MSIQSVLLRSYFQGRKLSIGLLKDGAEINSTGYRRQSPTWSVSGGEAKTFVSFGPFSGAVEYNGLVILDQDEVVDVVDLGTTTLPPGSACDQSLVITIDNLKQGK